jgi:hypothetical protein
MSVLSEHCEVCVWGGGGMPLYIAVRGQDSLCDCGKQVC